MRRAPHENVATVLVAPAELRHLEFALLERDLWVWPVATAPICADGPRRAFQLRRRMLEARRGGWDDAADWVPVWVSFGETWRDGDEPLPWSAHAALWSVLEAYGDRVRFRRRLDGVHRLRWPRGVA